MAETRRIDTQDKALAALVAVRRWQSDPSASVACPLCGGDGLGVVDRSSRPYAEWYALRCSSCGLDEALHVACAVPPA